MTLLTNKLIDTDETNKLIDTDETNKLIDTDETNSSWSHDFFGIYDKYG